jgi:membrane protease YdiL (CAAX protease family)
VSSLYYVGYSAGVMERILVRFIAGGLILSVLQYQLNRKAFLHFPKKHFWMWILVILTYPVISVYPQEIIYRLFIFRRYNEFFVNPVTFILISSIAFAYMHIIFGNYVAPILTFIGGIIFSITFYDSGSIIMSSFEHALWGDLLFTIGLGNYFYSGAIKKLEFIKNNAGDA